MFIWLFVNAVIWGKSLIVYLVICENPFNPWQKNRSICQSEFISDSYLISISISISIFRLDTHRQPSTNNFYMSFVVQRTTSFNLKCPYIPYMVKCFFLPLSFVFFYPFCISKTSHPAIYKQTFH